MNERKTSTFRLADGRAIGVSIKLGKAAKIREDFDIDLLQPGDGDMLKLLDIETLSTVVYALADGEEGLPEPEAFADLVDGRAIAEMELALLEALERFFDARPHYRAVIGRFKQATQEAFQTAAEMIGKLDTSELIRGHLSGGAPASSGSTPLSPTAGDSGSSSAPPSGGRSTANS